MKNISSNHPSFFIPTLQSIVLILFIGQTMLGQTSALDVKNGIGQSLLFVKENGKMRIGLGTDTSASLSLFGNDGFVASGTFGSGMALSLGAGTRLMWYPKKAAFRVGNAGGSEWDDANIGSYSSAMGSGTTASGSFSTAMGVSTIASGYSSTALGFRAIASGSVSTAMGYYTTASGDYSIIIGQGIDASNRLVNNTGSSLMVGFNSTIPTLFVGPGSGAGTFGKVGIGTSSPTTALHVVDTIYSSFGGFKFPDGTVQTTAATGRGGGNTLDQAYDQGGAGAGRIITADAGALEVGGVDGAVFKGTYGSGTALSLGSGVRMMWYPKKAAFRAGSAGGALWDDANIGTYSTAMGGSTMASGSGSTAMGVNITASGSHSTAMGYQTTASGNSSTAMGYGPTASGNYSTAMGHITTASGDYSTAMGYYTTASGSSSTAMGNRAKANHAGSIILAANSSGVSSDSVRTGGDEQMVLRADGGMYITNTSGQAPYDATRLINTSTGAYLSSGGAWTDASSRSYKENILNLSSQEAIGALLQLQPVTFNYKINKEEGHVGFIAEDVPELVSTKDRKGLSPMDIVAVLTKVVQNQQSEIELLKRKIEALEYRESKEVDQ